MEARQAWQAGGSACEAKQRQGNTANRQNIHTILLWLMTSPFSFMPSGSDMLPPTIATTAYLDVQVSRVLLVPGALLVPSAAAPVASAAAEPLPPELLLAGRAAAQRCTPSGSTQIDSCWVPVPSIMRPVRVTLSAVVKVRRTQAEARCTAAETSSSQSSTAALQHCCGRGAWWRRMVPARRQGPLVGGRSVAQGAASGVPRPAVVSGMVNLFQEKEHDINVSRGPHRRATRLGYGAPAAGKALPNPALGRFGALLLACRAHLELRNRAMEVCARPGGCKRSSRANFWLHRVQNVHENTG